MEDWDMVKISLPLDRIVKEEVADYMGYATLIGAFPPSPFADDLPFPR
jgi:hypothetical protein